MNTKYNSIGIDYNLTRKADGYLTEQLLYHLNPTQKGSYLDIGCGTGNYTIALHKKGFRFIGIDPSELMLEKARKKCNEIEWLVGSAEKTGLPNNSVDGIIGILTIHHWKDLKKGFSELHRVLKPNGTVVIFTSTPKQMKGYWLNHYFPKMLSDSINQMPSLHAVKTVMKESGFKVSKIDTYAIQPDLQDKFLYCGKQNPELYFDKQIRQGISSFSSLANRDEVEKGLSELKTDIDRGKIASVMKSYENNFGDYLFLIGRKQLNY
ncbi:class I SAM-dependent methyltransferase [uncultured Croceitalea sp.]|uniref:class I SAM-dependent methyltransferase n=1 Tax=uncultured Croceitalea sp. TaxID=1798908 RepID=UPI003305B528